MPASAYSRSWVHHEREIKMAPSSRLLSCPRHRKSICGCHATGLEWGGPCRAISFGTGIQNANNEYCYTYCASTTGQGVLWFPAFKLRAWVRVYILELSRILITSTKQQINSGTSKVSSSKMNFGYKVGRRYLCTELRQHCHWIESKRLTSLGSWRKFHIQNTRIRSM